MIRPPYIGLLTYRARVPYVVRGWEPEGHDAAAVPERARTQGEPTRGGFE